MNDVLERTIMIRISLSLIWGYVEIFLGRGKTVILGVAKNIYLSDCFRINPIGTKGTTNTLF